MIIIFPNKVNFLCPQIFIMLHIFYNTGFIFLSTTSVKFGVIDMPGTLSGSVVHFRARSVSIIKLLFPMSPMRNTSDFSKLILRPHTSDNLLNVCKIALIDSSLNSVKNLGHLHIAIFDTPASCLYAFWTSLQSDISAHKMKRYGDKGQPCRTPRPRLKYSECQPLFVTELFFISV